MPQPGQLRQWKIDMREKVADAYPWDSEGALAWVKEIDKARCNSDLSANPYPELEIQLAKAAKKCIKKNHVFSGCISQLILNKAKYLAFE